VIVKVRGRSKKNKRKRLRPRGGRRRSISLSGLKLHLAQDSLGTWRSRWEEQEIESFGVLEKV
jgi:hypothetical protein